MSLSHADLEAIRAIIRAEVARAFESGGRSPTGKGAPVQGDDRCDQKEERRHMDRTDEAANGESSKLRQLARDRLARLTQKPRPSTTSPNSTTRRKAGP